MAFSIYLFFWNFTGKNIDTSYVSIIGIDSLIRKIDNGIEGYEVVKKLSKTEFKKYFIRRVEYDDTILISILDIKKYNSNFPISIKFLGRNKKETAFEIEQMGSFERWRLLKSFENDFLYKLDPNFK